MAHAFSKPIEVNDADAKEIYTCELCRGEVDDCDYVGCCRDGDCPHRVDRMCKDCAEWTDDGDFWMCRSCTEVYKEKKVCEEAIEKLEEVLETFRDLRGGRGDIYAEMMTSLHDLIAQANAVVARWDA